MIKEVIPSFVIAGAPKCATTSMAHYLSSHPQILFSELKEPFYWASDLPGMRENLGVTSLEKYLALFRGDQSKYLAIGEASTLYLYSHMAIPDLLEFNPDVKVIVILRNPVEIVQSYHLTLVRVLQEDEKDLSKAWSLQELRRGNQKIPKSCPDPGLLQYGKIASLGEQIDRLYSLVPEHQRLTLFYEDVRQDTSASYKEILRFLKVPYYHLDSFPVYNKTSTYRWAPVTLALQSKTGRAIRRLGKRCLHGPAYRLVDRAVKKLMFQPQKKPDISNELLRELEETFREDIMLLSERCKRDLTHWLRDSR